jgi:hypothetical protein
MSVPCQPGRDRIRFPPGPAKTEARRTIALHYPSALAPPIGVWWWDDAASTVRHHYLTGYADDERALAGVLADATAVSDWDARLALLRQRSSTDKVRTVPPGTWAPVDFLLSTIAHWSLRW